MLLIILGLLIMMEYLYEPIDVIHVKYQLPKTLPSEGLEMKIDLTKYGLPMVTEKDLQLTSSIVNIFVPQTFFEEERDTINFEYKAIYYDTLGDKYYEHDLLVLTQLVS